MEDYTNDALVEAEKLKQSGQHNEAIRLCEKILLDDLDCAAAYEEIGDNYLSLQKYTSAERALLRAVDLAPESANANYLLGFSYSEQGLFSSAISHFETANTLKPNHPEILRCLGWSHFHAGSAQQGLVFLERARTLAPQDDLILMDLGVCYLSSRRLPRSRKCFEEVLQLDPNNKKALSYCQEIDKILQNFPSRSE